MYSGRQALNEIDQSLQKIRSELSQTDYELERYGQKLLGIRQKESESYRQLAKMRLDAIQANQLSEQLDYAERQAAQLLIQRNDQIEIIANKIETSQTNQLQFDQERNQQAIELDKAVEALEDLLAKVDGKLESDKSFLQQQLTAQDLVDMASNANDKTAQAEQELEDKGAPYRADKIFMYLWQRQYGTSQYNAGFITRFFDKKLAKHIDYDKARVNYFTLTNIPKKLAEHTENLQQQAQNELAELQQMQRDFEIDAGAEQLESTVGLERKKLSAIDQKLTAEEETYQNLIKKRESFNLETDKYIAKAISILMESFKAEPISQLQYEARQTESPRDDHLTNQLLSLKEDKSQLEENISSLQLAHKSVNRKLEDLKEVRRKFKRSDYDAYNSKFKDGVILSGILAQFIGDQVNAKELWRIFKRSQRFEKRRYTQRHGGIGLPGGINFPSNNRGPSIKFPRGIRFPSGWGGGGSSSGGGGGFKTGGGF
ncbi:hypothetical protein [Kangiella sp. HZ709]|uniref:hypothetical protein n=1 Tax=Kangiella sp. HZ709 TaxID=2666328 RepID=UPI0012B06F8C|nr:hypothetical protein [Kangiella sp. HZ709]MRX26546.1 hypothetical protein [Kangiella sp. HZ709]